MVEGCPDAIEWSRVVQSTIEWSRVVQSTIEWSRCTKFSLLQKTRQRLVVDR